MKVIVTSGKGDTQLTQSIAEARKALVSTASKKLSKDWEMVTPFDDKNPLATEVDLTGVLDMNTMLSLTLTATVELQVDDEQVTGYKLSYLRLDLLINVPLDTEIVSMAESKHQGKIVDSPEKLVSLIVKMLKPFQKDFNVIK